MKLEGSFVVTCPPAKVWLAINDPDVLAQAIPGCDRLVPDTNGYDATVVMKVGPVKARFSGRVTITEALAPERLVLAGEGSGGVAGFAKGEARVNLTPVPEGTEVAYAAEVAVGGKLAQIGSRLIASTARKLAQQFFESLNRQLAETEEDDHDRH